MENTNWFKQAQDKPLFEDVLWSRPENRRHAGKLLIIGGNKHLVAAPGIAYSAAQKAGIGSCRVILPSSTKRMIGKVFPEADFAPSTPSGSFARESLDLLLEHAQWADGVLLAGDFGRNSETAILLESFAEKYQGQLTIAHDGVDYFLNAKSMFFERENTLPVINFGKLQKLAMNNPRPPHLSAEGDFFSRNGRSRTNGTVTEYRREKSISVPREPEQAELGLAGAGSVRRSWRPNLPIKYEMNMHQLIEVLQQWKINLITNHAEQFVVSAKGKISTTKIPQESNWQVELPAFAATWWLQQPQKTFEALTTSIFQYSEI
jgi:hypothetical protein